jgi:hypothetical protein
MGQAERRKTPAALGRVENAGEAMTWAEFKNEVDAKLTALGISENVELDFVDVNRPTEGRIEVHGPCDVHDLIIN